MKEIGDVEVLQRKVAEEKLKSALEGSRRLLEQQWTGLSPTSIVLIVLVVVGIAIDSS
jgi:hypothetical protein